MTSAPDGWDRRISRARQLIDRFPAAAEMLRFYAALTEYQRSLGGQDTGPVSWPRTFADAMDRTHVCAACAGFLDWLAGAAPSSIVERLGGLRNVDDHGWHRRLENYLGGARDGRDPHDVQVAFVIEAVLQPFAERAAALTRPQRLGSSSGGSVGPSDPPQYAAPREPPAAGMPSAGFERAPGDGSMDDSQLDRRICPICGDLPVVGVLREEGQGARRSLVCALCSTEWPSRRVFCVACGEERFDALPVYTADQFPHVRIDACDTCRVYLKTIDLTKDGLAVPQVDDLATVSLDLWAREQGYARLRANLLRT